MIIVEGEQNTPEWEQTRLGIATASCFPKILTPSLKPSSQADEYLNLLLAEWISGEHEEVFQNYWMQRGHELEPEARSAYSLETGLHVEQPMFIYKDEDRMVGCSPDGLIKIGDQYDRGFEAKAPKQHNHIRYTLGNCCPKQYIPQVQGSIWVCDTDIDEWDFASYHPTYGLFSVTVGRDVAYQNALDNVIPEFIERLKRARESDQAIELRQLRIDQQAIEGEGYEWG